MAQFDLYLSPGSNKVEIPYLVSIQNNHITNISGTVLVVPLRTNIQSVDVISPLIDVAGKGKFVLSTQELFAIDVFRLKAPVATLNIDDRAKIKPAVDKVIGEY